MIRDPPSAWWLKYMFKLVLRHANSQGFPNDQSSTVSIWEVVASEQCFWDAWVEINAI